MPPLSAYQLILPVEIDAQNTLGTPIHQLGSPLTIRITFTAPRGLNPFLAQIYTVDAQGNTQVLPTTVTDDGGGIFTATAQTLHLSPFGLFAPQTGAKVPLAYLPDVIEGAAVGGW